MLVAPDKFRGTLDAVEAATAIGRGVELLGLVPALLPLADGGEGTLQVLGALGGETRHSRVTGPTGNALDASWRWFPSGTAPAVRTVLGVSADEGFAVLESAEACGLSAAGGRAHNRPLAATSAGVGELLLEAIAEGARTVVVGLGGSASTDGGSGALAVLEQAGACRPCDRGRAPMALRRPGDPRPVRLVAACDVAVGFCEAASRFAAQKGATAAEIDALTERLSRLAARYLQRSGIDVERLQGAGAAGGLGGALAQLGAELRPGAELVGKLLDLESSIERADVVITGEGCLDGTTASGKVVRHVLECARALGCPAIVIAGEVTVEGAELAERLGAAVWSLVGTCGRRPALENPASSLEAVTVCSLSAPRSDSS